MLKAPRVPIAVVFSAPPTSPLSKVEQWNVKSFVHGWDERAPSNVVFYHSSQKYANNNNWMCTAVVHTLWVYIRIVRWLECEGEEEGRGNRDLIEWLPGKLVYSRFLPTTSRRRMCGCGGNPLSALSGHLSTQCTNTCTSYMCACSCQVRSMEPSAFPCTANTNWTGGKCQKIGRMKRQKVASDIHHGSKTETTALTIKCNTQEQQLTNQNQIFEFWASLVEAQHRKGSERFEQVEKVWEKVSAGWEQGLINWEQGLRKGRVVVEKEKESG